MKAFAIAWCALALPALAATMPATHMKVADEDGKPLAGVVALFTGTAHEGTITGHGGRGVTLFATEAVSNDAGELKFAAQDFPRQPFFMNTMWENPSMLLMKPGYAPLIVQNDLRIIPTFEEASVWEREGHVVRMKKATDKDMQTLSFTVNYKLGLPLAAPEKCFWKQTPQSLLLGDRLYPFPGKTNPLRTLLMNDALFAQNGCGSPAAFFAPYLAGR